MGFDCGPNLVKPPRLWKTPQTLLNKPHTQVITYLTNQA
jgi:hypothetical protein